MIASKGLEESFNSNVAKPTRQEPKCCCLSKYRLFCRCYGFMVPEGYDNDDDEVTAGDIFTALKERTTCAGLPHYHNRRGSVKKTFWFLVTLCCLGGLLFNLYQLANNYFAFKVDIYIKMKTENELVFPAVTICGSSGLKKSKLNEYLNEVPLAYLNQPFFGYDEKLVSSMEKKARKKRQVSNSNSFIHKSTIPSTSPTFSFSTSSLSLSPPPDCCCSCCFKTNIETLIYKDQGCSCAKDQFSYDDYYCLNPRSTYSIFYETSTTVRFTSTTTMTTPASFSNTETQTQEGRITTLNPSTTTPTTQQPPISGFSNRLEALLKNQTIIELMSKMDGKLKSFLGFNLKDLVLDCMFEGFDCRSTKYFSHIFNDVLGNCFIFNSGWHEHSVLKSLKTGRRNGLQLVLSSDQSEQISFGESVKEPTDNQKNVVDWSGITLTIHQPGTLSFPENQGIFIQPGTTSSLAVKQHNNIRASFPYNDCRKTKNIIFEKKNSEDNKNKTNDNNDDKLFDDIYEELYNKTTYSSRGCLRTCRQKQTIIKCGCGDPTLPLKGKSIGVTNDSLSPCSHSNQQQFDCMNNVTNQFNNLNLYCYCPEVCNETTYLASLSLGKWPTDVYRKVIINKYKDMVHYDIGNNLEENMAKVEVYYQEFNYESIEEVPSYELFQLISDSGGVVGLWLGMSFLTFGEFLEFLLDIYFVTMNWLLCKMRGKRKVGVDDTQEGGVEMKEEKKFEEAENIEDYPSYVM